MFRKKPYWGWLAIAILLGGIAIWSHGRHQAKMQPAAMAKAVQNKLWSREADLQKFLKDTSLIREITDGRLSDARYRQAQNQRFYLFAYKSNHLVFWNDDDLLSPADSLQDTIGHLVVINNQYCIRKTFFFHGQDTAIRAITALLPLKLTYPFENEYLRSHFSALEYIPFSTEVLVDAAPGAIPVYNKDGHRWLSLKFPEDEQLPLPPDNTTVWTVIAALAASLLWLQLLILWLARNKSWRLGLSLTVVLVILLRILPDIWTLPLGIEELTIFSPVIYGYNWLLSSLGDLLLNELALMWILVFILSETPFRRYCSSVRSKLLRIILTGLFTLSIPAVIYHLWIVLHSLVMDSQISFDVSHFHTINEYTVVGLLAIGLALIITELAIRLLIAQLAALIPNSWLRQGFITGTCLLLVVCFYPQAQLLYVLIIWMTIYILLLAALGNSASRLLSLKMIFVSLYTCASITLVLHLLIRSRDLEKDRIAYASHLLAQQDPLMEYNFRSIAPRLVQDQNIQTFIQHPGTDGRIAISRRLNILYFNTLINRYQPELYFFDGKGNGLFNAAAISQDVLNSRFDSGMPTQEDHLVFNEGAEGHNYLARIPIDSAGQRRGTLFIDLTLKKNINETVYPELLQPPTVNQREKDARYSYAIYTKGRRITQTSNYNFPAAIDTSGGVRAPVVKKISNGNYELRYQENPGSAVIVAGSTGSWLSAAILLSYVFAMHLLISLIALLYRGLIRLVMRDRTTPLHLTMQQRIHVSTLIILLISFLVVGIVTVLYFSDRNSQTSRDNMHKTTEIVARYIHQNLAQQGGLANPASMDSAAITPEFRYALYTLAASQKIDVNVFSNNGRLLIASQEDLYEQGMLARIMRPLAFRTLRAGGSIAEENEYVGYFPFLTCYTALRNDEGDLLGFISIPFFSSEKDLNDQISNIVVALINIYALLFFISSFLAFFISTRLTSAFAVLIKKFGQLNLQKNELLEWPYQDEIGLLVAEYNKMALKVEANAALLAQNEREGAWREMARQVAHEIKNPLTPMKLNIQYLQQALKSKRPDVEALAARVSASIIEQIDNLSYIASEFSNFATMPEAKPEIISLNDFILKSIPLYQGEDNITICLELPEDPLFIIADHSQLLRVFTNLMQNAIQSIPEDQPGKITVALKREEDQVLLSVKDNGSGIDEAAAGKIFKPYFTTKSSGTGLGLAMSRKIVELWKGEIWFESIAGEGTTFFIRMPLEKSGN